MPSSGGDAIQTTHNGGYVAFESSDGAYVYYTQTPGPPSGPWRISTSGGQPIKLVDGVIDRAIALLDTGVSYADRPEGRTDARLQFFDFGAGRSTTVVASLGQQLSFGLTATADAPAILYSRVDSLTVDLMVLDNFR